MGRAGGEGQPYQPGWGLLLQVGFLAQDWQRSSRSSCTTPMGTSVFSWQASKSIKADGCWGGGQWWAVWLPPAPASPFWGVYMKAVRHVCSLQRGTGEQMTNGSRLAQLAPGRLHYMPHWWVPAALVHRRGGHFLLEQRTSLSETLGRSLPSPSHIGGT